jgi:ribosomal protein S18 acetylase RimI-like enzyme
MMAGKMELRVLTPDDWADWRTLRLIALADAPHAFGGKLADWQGEGDREDRWRGRLSLPGSHNLMVFLDGKPVGMASGAPGESEGVAELLSMYVDRSARGLGVGDLLIREVERWARESGATVLELAVAEGNDPAIALYHRHGFTDDGRGVQQMPDGRPELVLSKSLTGPEPETLREPAAETQPQH